jgi:hypothetical protein
MVRLMRLTSLRRDAPRSSSVVVTQRTPEARPGAAVTRADEQGGTLVLVVEPFAVVYSCAWLASGEFLFSLLTIDPDQQCGGVGVGRGAPERPRVVAAVGVGEPERGSEVRDRAGLPRRCG